MPHPKLTGVTAATNRWLCFAYGTLAAGALVATQWQLIRFFRLPDNGGVWGFITDGFANPAASFLTLDLLMIALAAIIFMIVEGRRVGARHIWIYIVISLAVAISVAFPLFLLARQLRIGRAAE